MRSSTRRGFALTILLCTSTVALQAQRSVTAFAGVVAGVGGVPVGLCTQLGLPAELSFFALSLPFAKLGGVAPCGYSGGFNTLTATAAPLTNSRSLSPLGVEVPANGTTFDGTASSTANYGTLVAGAHANISAPVTNGDALFSSMGAATFSDSSTRRARSSPSPVPVLCATRSRSMARSRHSGLPLRFSLAKRTRSLTSRITGEHRKAP